MNLYFIRHGQTVYNAGHIVQGWTDVDLTKKGRAQAAGAALKESTPQIFSVLRPPQA